MVTNRVEKADGGADRSADTLFDLRRSTDWSWRLQPGPHNGLTDIAGIRVGHSTMMAPELGVCTGITVVDLGSEITRSPLPAAVHVINGYGKSTGLMQIEELGELESPIVLTGVFGLPPVLGALVHRLMNSDADIGGEKTGQSVNAVVMECNDSHMHDPRSAQPGGAQLADAFDTATSGIIPQGNVGAGSGMKTFDFAGAVGTSSRLLPAIDGQVHRVAALVLSNFGRREELLVAGRPVGRLIPDSTVTAEAGGSVIVVLATDLPATPLQLKRMARRAQNGLARVGCSTADTSGEVVLAFTTNRSGTLPRQALGPAFAAVAECVEEAVLNGLCNNTTTHGRAGRRRERFPADRLSEFLSN